MRAGQGILIISTTLLMLGIIMVNSASMRVSSSASMGFLELLTSRPTLLGFGACIALLIGSRFPLQRFKTAFYNLPIPLWGLICSFALLLCVYIPGIGHEVNGANRWLAFGSFSFQPSEVAKWSLVVAGAWWASTHIDKLQLFRKGFLPPIICLGALCSCIALEDLGTAVLLFLVGCGILFAAGAKFVHFLSLLPVVAIGFYSAVLSSPYRIERFKAYLYPFENPESTSFQILQSMHAISAGGGSGLGLGNGIHKFGYLPEDTTDFIFSVICEELGLVGALFVVVLYVSIMVLGIYVIKSAQSMFYKLIVLGVLLTVGIQATINILVVTALIPTKGIALPLLSNGGTGWLLTAFCIGLIDAIDKQSEVTIQPAEHDELNFIQHT